MSEIQKCIRCGRGLPKNKDYFFQLKEGVLRTRCKECFGKKFTNKVALKEGYRICQTCGIELPLTEEYFPIRNDTQTPMFRWECRLCRKERISGRWYANKEELSAKHNIYYYENRDAILAKQKKDRDENTDVYAEKNRQNYAKHREKRKASMRAWRARNRERQKQYRQDRAEHYKEHYRQYYCTDRGHEIILRIAQKKRSLKRMLPATLTAQDWHDCLDFFGRSCAYCGAKETEFQQDHVFPLSKGGYYTRTNIVPACRCCNSSKHANILESWYRSQPFFSESRLKKIYKWTRLKPNSEIQQLGMF